MLHSSEVEVLTLSYIIIIKILKMEQHGRHTHLAMHSISNSAFKGRRATCTADLAGLWSPKKRV